MQVLSFVYERQRLVDEKSSTLDEWSNAYEISLERCNDELLEMNIQSSDPLLANNRTAWLMQAATTFANDIISPVDSAILFAFVTSQLLVPSFPIEQRAQRLWTVDPRLRTYLVTDFYPRIFGCLGSTLAAATFSPDLDGNVFLAFLNCIIGGTNYDMESLVGASSAQRSLLLGSQQVYHFQTLAYCLGLLPPNCQRHPPRPLRLHSSFFRSVIRSLTSTFRSSMRKTRRGLSELMIHVPVWSNSVTSRLLTIDIGIILSLSFRNIWEVKMTASPPI